VFLKSPSLDQFKPGGNKQGKFQHTNPQTPDSRINLHFLQKMQSIPTPHKKFHNTTKSQPILQKEPPPHPKSKSIICKLIRQQKRLLIKLVKKTHTIKYSYLFHFLRKILKKNKGKIYFPFFMYGKMLQTFFMFGLFIFFFAFLCTFFGNI
jgi:hypothetical protein